MEGKTKALGLDRRKCPCLFAYREGESNLIASGHWRCMWSHTGLERSTCERIIQYGFQKQVEAKMSRASSQKTDFSVLISFCSHTKMRSTILTAIHNTGVHAWFLSGLRQHPTGDDDETNCGITSNLSLSDGKQLLLCLERSAVLLSMYNETDVKNWMRLMFCVLCSVTKSFLQTMQPEG